MFSESLQDVACRGVSLVVAPVAAGVLFELLGRRAQATGSTHTALFTWWGGSVFAFAIALGRLLVTSVFGV